MESAKSTEEPHARDDQNYYGYNHGSLPHNGAPYEKPSQGNQSHFIAGFFSAILPFLPLIGLQNAKTNAQRGYLFMGASLGAIILSLLFCGAWRILFSFDKACQIASSNNDEYRFTGCLTEDALMIIGFSFGFLAFSYGVASAVFYSGRKG